MMSDAVKRNNARPSSLALLEDRVASRTGKRQIYGSQVGRNQETGEFYVSPIKYPENIDKRPAEVGLGTIQDYINNLNITWDELKHNEMIEKLEAEKK
jgi:broad specificity phosphatase PhoE